MFQFGSPFSVPIWVPISVPCVFVLGDVWGNGLGYSWVQHLGPQLGHICRDLGTHLGHIWDTVGYIMLGNCCSLGLARTSKIYIYIYTYVILYVYMHSLFTTPPRYHRIQIAFFGLSTRLMTGTRACSSAIFKCAGCATFKESTNSSNSALHV
jgi:hypothetical protein